MQAQLIPLPASIAFPRDFHRAGKDRHNAPILAGAHRTLLLIIARRPMAPGVPPAPLNKPLKTSRNFLYPSANVVSARWLAPLALWILPPRSIEP